MQIHRHVNYPWIREQLTVKHLSQGDVAKILRLDRAAVSLMFHGKRRPQLHEVTKLAEILGQPLDTVIEMFGLTPPKEEKPVVVITGLVDEEGRVELLPKTQMKYAPRPAGVPGNTVALQLTDKGPFHGWIAYYVPSMTIQPEAVGRWAVVQVLGERGPRVGVMIPGSKDKWKMCSIYKLEEVTEYRIAWATPVIVTQQGA